MTTPTRRTLGLASLLLAFILLCAPLQSQETVAEKGLIAKVPLDALAFCHIKVNELWKSEVAASARELLQRVGAPALQAFDKRFAPGAATLDAICAFLVPGEEDTDPFPAVLVSFSAPFDSAKVHKALLPNATALNHFGQKYSADGKLDIAIKAQDTRTLLVTRVADMPRILGREPATSGPLQKHLAIANSKSMYAAITLPAVPQALRDQIPEAYEKILAAQELVFTGQAGKELSLTATLQFADEAAAKEGEAAARAGIESARDQIGAMAKDLEKKLLAQPDGKNAGISELPDALRNLVNLAMLKAIDEILRSPPLQTSGTTIVAAYSFDPNDPRLVVYTGGMLATFLTPAMEKSRAVALRAQGQANLKQLAIAMHNYEAAEGHLPIAIFAKDGKRPALLSWRVALLPYLEQKDLYKQFKLDEPWDSEHNKKLIDKMPAVFTDAEAPVAKNPGQTHYQVVINGGFVLERDGNHLRDVIDGTSNTVMIVTATDPVTWTKPEDLKYDPLKPVPKLGLGGNPANVALFDGSVRTLKAKIPDKTLRGILTRSGGELITEDF